MSTWLKKGAPTPRIWFFGVIFFIILAFSTLFAYSPAPNLSHLRGEDVKAAWKRRLFSRLSKIQVACGELCRINDEKSFLAHQVLAPNGLGKMIKTKEPDCQALMSSEDIDLGDPIVPRKIPDELMSDFTMNGIAKVEHLYKNDSSPFVGKQAVWDERRIDQMFKSSSGTYGSKGFEYITNLLKVESFVGKHVLVIGSMSPWVESIALHLGAAKVTTLEYRAIVSLHPKIVTMTPDRFRAAYLDNSLPMFDIVISHSSLEHSGLGRYGDSLNPWGDLIAVAKARCVTKPNGSLFLGLPSSSRDTISFNVHRFYGEFRWPLVTANWEPRTKIVFTVGTKLGGQMRWFRKVSQ